MAPHSSTLTWKIAWMGGAWWSAVHGVAKSWTQLSDFTLLLGAPESPQMVIAAMKLKDTYSLEGKL